MLRLFDEYTKRNIKTLNGDWQFAADRENKGVTEGWFKSFPENSRHIIVPGSWNTQFVDMFDYRGHGWLKRTFNCEECFLLLEFEAVSGQTDVWLDGEPLGSHYGGWTAFSFKKFVEAGEHTLVVCTEPNGNNLNTIPLAKKDWYNYGGIMRPVTATQLKTPFISDLQISYDLDLDKRRADICCEVEIENPFKGEYCTPITLMFDGNKVAAEKLTVNEKGSVTLKASVKDLKLWDIGEGNLYDITVITDDDDRNERIGFRKIEAKNREIFLNGKSIFLHGVNRHEEHPDWGFAVPPQINNRDIDIIKELNCNSVRGSHYPNSHIFLDELDRQGILFWSEIPMWGFSAQCLADPITNERAEVMITEMINQYRAHASIVIWGMHNEVNTSSPEGYEISKKLYALMKKLDSSRLITYASNQIENDISFEFCDVICINQYIGWYDGSLCEWKDFIKGLRVMAVEKGVGDKPIIMSEFGCGAIYGYNSFRNDHWTMSYQSEFLETVIKECIAEEGVCGTLIWQFTDIASRHGLNRARGYNNKGLLDEYRRPKTSFFTVRKLYEEIKNSKK